MSLKSKFLSLLICLLLSVGYPLSATAQNGAIFDTKAPLEQTLQAAGFDSQSLDLQWSLLDQFYARQMGLPVWHHNGWLSPHAQTLLGWIASADTHGLLPQDYHLARLGLFPPVTVGPPLQLRELLLSDAFFRLARDLHSGRFKPKEFDPLWFITAESFDPVTFLSESLQATSMHRQLTGLLPRHPSYAGLKRSLSHYRVIEALGGWPRVTAESTLRPGDRHSAVVEVRKRLLIEGDLQQAETDAAEFYDQGLQQAVAAFQWRQGLEADGIVGPLTLAALNIPVGQRIAQIQLNLERWRWLPQDLGSRFLLVNTAGYELTLTIDGEPLLHSRTINGKEQRQTPSFSSRITQLIVNPEWTVPRIIAVKDLLPKQQRDAMFLDSKEIRVLRLDGREWTDVDASALDWSLYHEDNFPFTLRQGAGSNNSLGLIKFHMPNSHAIFLHDTPSAWLFNKPIRAFSSGCVRVQDAKLLAQQLLQDSKQPVTELLERPLQSGITQAVELSNPMPVYLIYLTSWVDAEGVLQFRPDIYQRNDPLMFALGAVGDAPVTGQKTASIPF